MNARPVEPEAVEPEGSKRRILFMAEAVTLAHVARPHVLAESLPPEAYEVLFACDSRYNALLGDVGYARRPIHSIPAERFLQALARGAPVYDLETLEAYVEEDLAVIDGFMPDVIVGDFRLSLSVSARLRGIPYLGMTNGYWSPAADQRYPVPELPMTRWFGEAVSQRIFDFVRPLAFALHARPMNRLRRKRRMPPLEGGLRAVYADADRVLLADWPELVPIRRLPSNHDILGPILWSPEVERPEWWDSLCTDIPTVYVTLGSSGAASLLPALLDALEPLPIQVIAATANRLDPFDVPPGAYVASFLSGSEAAKRAALVVCNGGSPTTHQAIAEGKPVIGIPSNLDQWLNMGTIETYGAGKAVRPTRSVGAALRRAVLEMLEEPRFARAAEALMQSRPSSSVSFFESLRKVGGAAARPAS